MKYFILFLCIFWISDRAFSAECPTKNARGENCISTSSSVETDGDWVTYKESLTNSCDCTCNANFNAIGDVPHGDIVAPHGKGEVICLNVRGKGCRGFERSFQFTCQREGADDSSPPRSPRASSAAPSDQGRRFSKDECSVDACANADFGVTEMGVQQKDAAKAICDRQYLQCLKDGQAKPDPDEAVRIARSQVPDDPPPQPVPPPAQQQQPISLMTADGRHVIRCIRGFYGRDELICLTVEPSTETLDHTSVDGLVASVTGNEAIYSNVIRPFHESRPYP
jgi:hypothetical protein